MTRHCTDFGTYWKGWERVPKQQLPEIPVRFYRTASGREPVLDWLRTLDSEDRRIVEHRLALAIRRMKEVTK